MTKILLFQKLVPHYRIPVFRYLYQKLGIITIHSDPRPKSTWAMEKKIFDFPTINARRWFYRDYDQAIIQLGIWRVIKNNKPKIVILEASISYSTLWKVFIYGLFFKYKIILWGHGINNNELNRPFSSTRSKILLILFNRANAVITYSGERAEKVKDHINNSEKVFVAWNTIDIKENLAFQKRYRHESREQLKLELGLNNNFNLLFIGRLLESKGIRTIIDILEYIPNDMDYTIHFVGDGPEKIFLKETNNKRIKLHGPIYNSEKVSKIIYSSDIMIMPGYVGLSVMHAFSLGCPVLTQIPKTQTGPFHSPESEYIIDGVNGYFCPHDPRIIATTIVKYLLDKNKQIKMSNKALQTAQKYDIANMALGFSEALKFVNQNQ